MPKKQQHEEHESAERYLVTYADLITLLLGLFVILYASSKADTPKYIAVSNAMRNFFNGSGRVIDYGGARGGNLENLPNPTKAGGELTLVSLKEQIMEALEETVNMSPEGYVMEAQGPDDNIGAPLIKLEMQERGLVIHLAESMFFDSGSAKIKKQGVSTLDIIAQKLNKVSNNIRVEGHTDNTPIKTAKYPSNWHLSAMRAINTATYLMGQHNINGTRVSVAGYGEFRPITKNDTPEQRKINRRVDLVVLSKGAADQEPKSTPLVSSVERPLPPDVRPMLPEHRALINNR